MNVRRWEGPGHWVEIDLDKCVGSGNCSMDCPAEVYKTTDGSVSAENIGDCVECGVCEGICPHKAILRHSAWQNSEE